MWLPRLLAPLVTSTLLLSSTAGLAVHDHTGAAQHAGYDCAADHSGGGAAAASGAPHLERAGKNHRHDCLGCKLSSHRSLTAAARHAIGSLGPDAPASAAVAEAPAARLVLTSRSLRGPPRA